VQRIAMKAVRTLAAAVIGGALLATGMGTGSSHAANLVAANPLTTGCNQVTETNLPSGGKVSDWVSANVQPSSAVISVWHYDNASQAYKAAYFQMTGVPVDQPTFASAVDAYFICVSANASAP
jgi:hypothetical protein